MIYGYRVKQVRRMRGLTQAAFAEQIGISPRQLSEIEAGFSLPPQHTLDSICTLTGFPPSFFHRPPGPELPLGSLLFHRTQSP